MPLENRQIPAREYEDTLKRIRDVITARVVLDQSGEIEELHVLAGPGRGVKYIARDVESSIIAAFGVPIDRRKISIAQLGGEETGNKDRRVQLEKVEIISEADTARITVHLRMGSAAVAGSASGVPTPKSWLFIAANAAVSAAGQFLSPEVSFHVEDASVSTSRTIRIALVSLVLLTAGGEQILTGSCPVVHDEREAVVKATLDALNRKFAQLMSKE